MSVERLSFSSESEYNAVELAVHLARYSLAQNLCQGLDVLDVACGEGYGSYAMASFWGAKSVKGVDISEEAIKTARDIFSHPKIEYLSSPAETIDELFEQNRFDLIISLETIEHVNNPEKFLSAVKTVLKPDGIFILSCPNDHWYYGPGESQNPFHLRTYYFDEFKEMAENLLGKANCFLFGRPLNGFGNFLPADSNKPSDKKMADELKSFKAIQSSRLSADESIPADDCSYFVGVWGDLPVKKEALVNCAFYPTSMNKFSLTLEDLNKSLVSEVSSLKPNLESAEKWNKELQTAINSSEKRISDLEKWTVELQAVLRNSENRVSELEKWTEELQMVLRNSENRVSELDGRTVELQSELSEANKQIEIAQSEAEKLQQELETAKEIIINMEASKFWKLRNHWFRLKDSMPVNKKKA